MNREEISDIVLDMLAIQFHKEKCTEDTLLRSEWHSTSIDEMEFMLSIEERFNMELFDQIKTVHIETPQQIIDLIMEK